MFVLDGVRLMFVTKTFINKYNIFRGNLVACIFWTPKTYYNFQIQMLIIYIWDDFYYNSCNTRYSKEISIIKTVCVVRAFNINLNAYQIRMNLNFDIHIISYLVDTYTEKITRIKIVLALQKKKKNRLFHFHW